MEFNNLRNFALIYLSLCNKNYYFYNKQVEKAF